MKDKIKDFSKKPLTKGLFFVTIFVAIFEYMGL